MKFSKFNLFFKSFIVCILSLFLLCSCDYFYFSFDEEDAIKVSFIDVGQGDSVFVQLPNSETLLIDAGVRGVGKDITDYIENSGCEKIDYLIATHPHADHIGSMEYVVEHIDVGKIYMTEAITDTKTFENLLTTIDEQGYKLTKAEAGQTIVKDEDLFVQILGPNEINEDDLNNSSVIVKITYGSDDYLFIGDAEKSELETIPYDLSADVLKVGHHGSNTSTYEELLQKVNPYYAVISCGKNNDYGHPHKETLSLLDDFGIDYYRTDKQGTIVITSHGDEDFCVTTEK